MGKSQRIPVCRIWLAVLLGYLALGATLQELPNYLKERFDAGPLVIGVTVGLAFAGTAIARPLAGRAGDSGQSRRVAAIGGALTAGAAIGHLLAPDLGLLLLARLVMGVGEGALFSGSLPWVLRSGGQSRGGRVAGWFGLSMWSGLSAGPLLGLAADTLGGARAVWSLVIALPAVSTALILSTRSAAAPPTPLRIRGWRDLLPAGFGMPGAILGLAAYGYGALTALLVLFLGTPGLGGQGLGLVVFSVAFLVTRAAGSPLVDRHGGLAVARRVPVVEAAGFALLATSTSEASALVAVAVIGVGLGLIYPASIKLTLTRAAAPAAGAAMGAMTSFWDLGVLGSGPLSGLVTASISFRAAFWVAALAALISFTLATIATPSTHRRRLGAGAFPGNSTTTTR